MVHRAKYFISILILAAAVMKSPAALANPSREFIMSCTYGVLAGTLVGAAMLAFEDQPGDHLSKVARGASLGLYAGILLGAYVVYLVPDEQEPDLYDQPGYPQEEGSRKIRYLEPKLALAPTFGEKGIDGFQASYRLLSF